MLINFVWGIVIRNTVMKAIWSGKQYSILKASFIHTAVQVDIPSTAKPVCDLGCVFLVEIELTLYYFLSLQVMEQQMLEEMEKKRIAQEDEEKRKQVSCVCVGVGGCWVCDERAFGCGGGWVG